MDPDMSMSIKFILMTLGGDVTRSSGLRFSSPQKVEFGSWRWLAHGWRSVDKR